MTKLNVQSYNLHPTVFIQIIIVILKKNNNNKNSNNNIHLIFLWHTLHKQSLQLFSVTSVSGLQIITTPGSGITTIYHPCWNRNVESKYDTTWDLGNRLRCHDRHGDERKIKKEKLRKTRMQFATKLSRRNLMKGLNTQAISLVRYSGQFLKRTRHEFEQMDKRTRKLMTILKLLHPRDDVDRLYVSRKEAERGFASIEEMRTNKMVYPQPIICPRKWHT